MFNWELRINYPSKKNKLKRNFYCCPVYDDKKKEGKHFRFHVWVYSPHNKNWGSPVTYINGYFNKEIDAIKYSKKIMKKYMINRAYKNHYPNWKTPLKEIFI